MVVDNIIAAMPVNVGINAAVSPVRKFARTRYNIDVTITLTTLNTYTKTPEINFMRLRDVHTISKISVAITAQAQMVYKTFAHIGKVRVMANKIDTAAIVTAMPNKV